MFPLEIRTASYLLQKFSRSGIRIKPKRLFSKCCTVYFQKPSPIAVSLQPEENDTSHLLDHTLQPRAFVKIFGLLNSYIDSMVVFSGVSLGIFDYLSSQIEHVNAKLVADHIGGEEKTTKLVLDYLVSLDLLTKHDTNGAGCSYCLTDISEAYLTFHGENTLVPFIKMLHKVSYPAFGNLKWVITEGKGTSSRNEENGSETFLKVAETVHASCSKVIANAFDLSHYSQTLHIGGSHEALASELCSAYPDMAISVLRLPLTRESNHLELCKLREKTGGRINFTEIDYWVNDLPTCDLVVLSPLVWNWPNKKLTTLLRKVHCAGAAVFTTAENALESIEYPPVWKLQRALLQLSVGSLNENKLSTESVQEQLIKAGFKNTQVKRSRESIVDAVIGKIK